MAWVEIIISVQSMVGYLLAILFYIFTVDLLNFFGQARNLLERESYSLI